VEVKRICVVRVPEMLGSAGGTFGIDVTSLLAALCATRAAATAGPSILAKQLPCRHVCDTPRRSPP
jgi:hypothetical protein